MLNPVRIRSAKENIVQLIVDCRKFSHLFDDEEVIWNIEKLSRNLCYRLHIKRLPLLRNLEGGCLGHGT